MDIRKNMQTVLNSKENTPQKVDQIIEELEAIKKEWFEALSDLKNQRDKYKELNKELLEMRNEILKFKQLL